jgi:transcriptional regulator with XRE-family HTH domain
MCYVLSEMRSGDLVYLARSLAAMTQAELGARAGMAQNAVSRIERGEVDPSFGTVLRLVRACGLELEISFSARDDSYARDIRRRLELTPAQRLEQAVNLAHVSQAMRRAALGESA